MFCRKCGASIAEDSKFCKKCGTAVKTSFTMQSSNENSQMTLRNNTENESENNHVYGLSNEVNGTVISDNDETSLCSDEAATELQADDENTAEHDSDFDENSNADALGEKVDSQEKTISHDLNDGNVNDHIVNDNDRTIESKDNSDLLESGFRAYVDKRVSELTKYSSAEELLKNEPFRHFKKLVVIATVIRFIYYLILTGEFWSSLIETCFTVGVISILIWNVLGLCRISSYKNEKKDILSGTINNIDIDNFVAYLNRSLGYLDPSFQKWGYFSYVSNIYKSSLLTKLSDTLIEFSNNNTVKIASKGSKSSSPYSIINLTQNDQSINEMSYSITADKTRKNSGNLAIYDRLFTTAPIIRAAIDYYCINQDEIKNVLLDETGSSVNEKEYKAGSFINKLFDKDRIVTIIAVIIVAVTGITGIGTGSLSTENSDQSIETYTGQNTIAADDRNNDPNVNVGTDPSVYTGLTNNYGQEISIGDKIRFGDHVWNVIDKSDNKALIITEDIVDILPYNNKSADVTWETCSLREYLNNDFYNTFSDVEKKSILRSNVINKGNDYSYGGNDTNDNVFLLSSDEAALYYPYDSQDWNNLTANTKDREAYYHGELFSWWLRSPGGDQSRAQMIECPGLYTDQEGAVVDYDHCGVRPVMWIDWTQSCFSVIAPETEKEPVPISEAMVGDRVKLGNYTWKVLDNDGTQVLVICEDIVDSRSLYDMSNSTPVWSNSELRNYLNNDFYNRFSDDDKKHILARDLLNDDGISSTDKVFVLSYDELNKYLPYDQDRALLDHGDKNEWLLRSSGYDSILCVTPDGALGERLPTSPYGIRPAMWIKPDVSDPIEDQVSYGVSNVDLYNSVIFNSVCGIVQDQKYGYDVLYPISFAVSETTDDYTLYTDSLGESMQISYSPNNGYDAKQLKNVLNELDSRISYSYYNDDYNYVGYTLYTDESKETIIYGIIMIKPDIYIGMEFTTKSVGDGATSEYADEIINCMIEFAKISGGKTIDKSYETYFDTPIHGKVITVGDPLNMHSDESTNSEIIEKIPNGTIVEIDYSGEEWYRASYGGITGYISKDYVEIQNDIPDNYLLSKFDVWCLAEHVYEMYQGTDMTALDFYDHLLNNYADETCMFIDDDACSMLIIGPSNNKCSWYNPPYAVFAHQDYQEFYFGYKYSMMTFVP